MTYTCKLMKREEVAEGTMVFHFKKPRGFQFRPGQRADLTLVNRPETDREGNTRTFSFINSPSEDELVFATRMRNTVFKRTFRVVPLGTTVGLEGPMGSFTLHKNAAKLGIFLLGKHLPNLQGPSYYIAGPPGMVAALRQMLPAAGVDEDDIRSEEFGGY